MTSTEEKQFTKAYRVLEITDPRYHGYATVPNGGARDVAWRAWEHLLRFAAEMPPGAVSVSLRYVFLPEAGREHPQLRLQLSIVVRADERSAGLATTSLIEHSPLGELYLLQEAEPPTLPWRDLRSVCHIHRRDAAIAPLLSHEWNPEIPEAYFSCDQFTARRENDYLLMDQVGGALLRPVVVDICAEPMCGKALRRAHVAYGARLRAINQTWCREDGEDALPLFGDSEEAWPGRRRENVLKPYRRPDPMADEISRRQRRFGETLEQPRLRWHAVALATDEASSRLVGSTVAECAFSEGTYQLSVHSDAQTLERLRDAVQRCRPLDSRVAPVLLLSSEAAGTTDLSGLCHTATADELQGLFRLPVGGTRSPQCIRMKTDPPIAGADDKIVLGHVDGHPVGGRQRDATAWPAGIPSAVLTKHVFVSGMPGSGKTTALMNLMIELHKRGIPFLTIECSKRDFRALTKLARKGDAESLSLAQDLQVYTLGKEDVSPFRMNPLALASDVTLPEHLDSVLACFYAAMPLSGPLPAVLGEALELVYEGQENGDPPPVMADLVKAAEEVLKSKGYSPDVESDIRAAIEVRLTVLVCRSMGKILQSPSAVPAVEALLSGYSVIELDRLPVDQKCLTSLFLLKAILDEVRSLPPHADGLRFVVLIDEAHNVVGSTSSSVRSEDLADPGSHASEYVCRMLAELRGLGVGIVISDQLPTAVASEVVKQTGTKLAFRQVDLTDREIISRAMLLTQVEEEDLARLRPGEAFFFTEGLYAPLRIRTVNLHQDLDLAPPSDCELGRIIRREPWFKANATALGALEFTFASGQSDIFDGERANIAAKAARLLSCLLSAKATNDDAARQRKLVALHAEVCPLQERLRSLSRGFRRTVLPSVERYSRQAEHDHPWPPELIDAWGEFARRVHDVTLADTERLLGLLGRVVTECGASRNTRV